MDRSLMFLLGVDPGDEDGEAFVEFSEEVRSGGDFGGSLLSLVFLSRLGGMGIVGLSGMGNLLNLFPSLYAGGTPRCPTGF